MRLEIYSQKYSTNFTHKFLWSLKIVFKKQKYQYAIMSMSKSILNYFHKTTVKSALSDPKGPLAEEIPSSLITAANKDVLEILEKPVTSKKKGNYIRITPEKKQR